MTVFSADRRSSAPRIVSCVVVASLLSTAVFAAPTPPPAPAPSSSAAAPSPAALQEAQDRYKKGLELYKLGSSDAALVEFEKAYQLSQKYQILYNIGLVYRDMKDFVGAVRTFDRYLSEGGNDIDSKKRAEVQAEYDKIKRYVAQITVITNLEGADVFIDDLPVGKTPLKAISVNAGRRKIAASRDGSPTVTQIVNAPGGEALKVEIKLQEPKPISTTVPTATTAPTSAPTTTATTPPPPPPTPSKFTTLSWVGLGSAGVLAIAATGTGVAALGASNDLKKESYGTDAPSSAAKDQQSKVRTLALATDLLAGAAVVTTGITLYLTLSRDPKPHSPTVGLALVPSGGALVGSF